MPAGNTRSMTFKHQIVSFVQEKCMFLNILHAFKFEVVKIRRNIQEIYFRTLV